MKAADDEGGNGLDRGGIGVGFPVDQSERNGPKKTQDHLGVKRSNITGELAEDVVANRLKAQVRRIATVERNPAQYHEAVGPSPGVREQCRDRASHRALQIDTGRRLPFG